MNETWRIFSLGFPAPVSVGSGTEIKPKDQEKLRKLTPLEGIEGGDFLFRLPYVPEKKSRQNGSRLDGEIWLIIAFWVFGVRSMASEIVRWLLFF